MKRIVILIVLFSAGGGLAACSGDPIAPAPSSPTASELTTAEVSAGDVPAGDQPSTGGVAQSAMLLASDLPGDARLTESDPQLPEPSQDGIPGDPFCNAYNGTVVTGFTLRTAMRTNIYTTAGGDIGQRVERYPDPATAAQVFDELRTMVLDCGIWEHTVTDHATPLQAGDRSWRFTARGYHNERYWQVVQQGDLLSIVHSDVPLEDLSPAIVQQLCTDTAHC